MTHKGNENEEKNKLLETNPELTKNSELTENDFTTVIRTKCSLFEKQRLEDMKDVKSNIQ